MAAKAQKPPGSYNASINKVAKIEKIVEYSFDRSEKANVLAIHPTRHLLAYLINIQKPPKGYTSNNDSGLSQGHSPSIASNDISNLDKNKSVSIRIIDYVTRQRCLAKGVYHARPVQCVFTINSLTCKQNDIIKLAVVDKLANVYLYDIVYNALELTATRIAVLRAPGQEPTPKKFINLVWCPFVPCEDFEDGDGGLRLALSTDRRIEIFAIDRIQGQTGELQRSDLKGAYKCIDDAHKSNIVTLSISPDCSTISAAALDNRVTFFSSDIEVVGQKSLHTWEADIPDGSGIAKLFFLDNYPKLLEDSTMKFWGAAFIGTRSGYMLLVDLKTWTVYQKINIQSASAGLKDFDYQIDLTSKNIIAMNCNQCFIVQLNHPSAGKLNQHSLDGDSGGLPRIVSATRLDCGPSRSDFHTSPIYKFVIKHKSDEELELFTITFCSLERYIINLNTLNSDVSNDMRGNDLEKIFNKMSVGADLPTCYNIESSPLSDIGMPKHMGGYTPSKSRELDVHDLVGSSASQSKKDHPQHRPLPARTQPTPIGPISSSNNNNTSSSNNSNNNNNNNSDNIINPFAAKNGITPADAAQMDRMVDALFTRLNVAFSRGLDEFLGDVKHEVNDLKFKIDGLSKEVRRLQQQIHDRQK